MSEFFQQNLHLTNDFINNMKKFEQVFESFRE